MTRVALLNAIKTHLVAGGLGLTTDTVIIGRMDPSLAQPRKTLVFITPVSCPERRIDDDLKRCSIDLVIGCLIAIDTGNKAQGDVEQLINTYDPIHAKLEELEPSALTGAKKFLMNDSGPIPLGFGDHDNVVAMICGWTIEHERTSATTGA